MIPSRGGPAPSIHVFTRRAQLRRPCRGTPQARNTTGTKHYGHETPQTPNTAGTDAHPAVTQACPSATPDTLKTTGIP